MSDENNKEIVEEQEEVSMPETVDGMMMKELGEAQAEAVKYKDEFLRARADMENLRKRFVREKEATIKNANMALIEELLPVMDSLYLGMDSAEKAGSGSDIIDGIKMVLSQTKAVLINHGLKELDPVGEKFDPNWHECVSHMAHGEMEENMVIEVVRRGYALHDRLLRPAFVVVSSGKSVE